MPTMRGYGFWKLGCVAAVLLFTFALSVLARVYSSLPGDEWLLVRIQELQTDWLDSLALALAWIGDVPLAGVPVVLVVVLLLVLRRHTDALIVAISLAPLLGLHALKEFIGRSRPDYLLLGPKPESLGFPSGHSAYAFIFGGVLIYLVGQLVPAPAFRRWLQAGLVALILAMGASRVYLGVHWPSDVIGGYLYGITVLLGVVAVVKLLADPRVARFRRRILHRKLPW